MHHSPRVYEGKKVIDKRGNLLTHSIYLKRKETAEESLWGKLCYLLVVYTVSSSQMNNKLCMHINILIYLYTALHAAHTHIDIQSYSAQPQSYILRTQIYIHTYTNTHIHTFTHACSRSGTHGAACLTWFRRSRHRWEPINACLVREYFLVLSGLSVSPE